MTAQTYTFNYNGTDYTIPAFADLPVGVVRKARKGKDDTDKVFLILESCVAEDSPELEAIDRMTQDEFAKFITEWTQGAGVGEA